MMKVPKVALLRLVPEGSSSGWHEAVWRRSAFVGAGEGLAVSVDFRRVSVGERYVVIRRVVGGGRRWFDAHTEFDTLAQTSAEGVDDRLAQMTFDLVLDEGAGNRE